MLLNATSWKDAKGCIVGVVGVGQDITFLSKAMTESRLVADDFTRQIDFLTSTGAPDLELLYSQKVTLAIQLVTTRDLGGCSPP